MKSGNRTVLGQKLTVKPKQKLITRIRLSSFIELGEKRFSEYVAEVENDPIFKKLLSFDNAERRVITHKGFPGAVFELGSIPIKEQLSADGAPVDVEKLLLENNVVADVIKNIGLKNFEKYFLQGDTLCALPDICDVCGISVREAESVMEFINELSIRGEFYHPSGIETGGSINYSKIAEIEYEGRSKFVINYFSHRYVSGRYEIDAEKLTRLKKQNAFKRDELSNIKKLFEKIELINARKSTIYQIIRKIIEVQKNFLYSGEEKFLVPYTQKQLSKDIGIDNSVVCRAVYGRSIVTPHKIEKPLKYFFPRTKSIRKTLIKKVIESEHLRLTDKKITQLLKSKFNIDISRRSVNVCRNEILKQDKG